MENAYVFGMYYERKAVLLFTARSDVKTFVSMILNQLSA